MTIITEKLKGIVERVTYHNPDNGWSVLRVAPFNSPGRQETVTVHQTKVYAGATMEFRGAWSVHPQFGRQFKASEAIEKKPASPGFSSRCEWRRQPLTGTEGCRDPMRLRSLQ